MWKELVFLTGGGVKEYLKSHRLKINHNFFIYFFLKKYLHHFCNYTLTLLINYNSNPGTGFPGTTGNNMVLLALLTVVNIKNNSLT